MAKGEQPAFNVRAKAGEYWYNVGAAWHVKDGGISLRLNVLPVAPDWDGSLLLLPPKEVEPRESGGDPAS